MGINYPRINLIWKLEKMVPKQRRHRSLQQPSLRSSGIRLSLRWSWLAYIRGRGRGWNEVFHPTVGWELLDLEYPFVPWFLSLTRGAPITWPAQTPLGTWVLSFLTSAPVVFWGMEMLLSWDNKCWMLEAGCFKYCLIEYAMLYFF